MRRVALIIWFVLFVSVDEVSAVAMDLYPFDNPKKSAQFQHILRDLRCLVCQNQDLVDSNASLAEDLREEVYTLIQDGKSDDDVIHYLTARYGDFILFKPPVKSVTALLWGGPLIFLVLGCWLFLRATRHD